MPALTAINEMSNVAHSKRHYCMNLIDKYHFIGLLVLVCLVAGCADGTRYNSKDLTTLPCERTAGEFFLPVEFDEDGKFVYDDQVDSIKEGLRRADQVYVFVHGWDKTTETAERDYQDLICRFHTHSRSGSSRTEKVIIIGVFWPATEFPRWLNFWKIKDRVDRIANDGFANLMEVISNISLERDKRYKLAFIGHSFGGRMVVRGLQDYINRSNYRTFLFLSNLEQLQLVLLNAAVGEPSLGPQTNLTRDYLDYKTSWNAEIFLNEMRQKHGDEDYVRRNTLVDLSEIRMVWVPTITQLASYTDLRVFNLMSSHDMADRYLYRLGSIMEEGGPSCAIGACGLQQWDYSVTVEKSGSMKVYPDLRISNVWNIDASQVVSSHSDIYKGRVANLLWELLSLNPPSTSAEDLKIDDASHSHVSSAWSLSGWSGWYEHLKRDHIADMETVNAFRRMSEREKLEIQRLNSLFFDLDGYLKRRNWVSAVATIRKLLEIGHCSPGWWSQVNVGTVVRGTIYDRERLGILRGRVCGWPQLYYVLAVVMHNLGDCAGALRILDYYTDHALEAGTQEHFSIGDVHRESIHFESELIRASCLN